MSMENCESSIACEAYAKINLHAARYSSELMCGFLLGSVKEANNTKVVVVEDVLPICHSNPVGPIFEVAGGMCRSIFPGKDVVGLYYTSDDGEYGNHDTTPYFVDKVCETIKGNNTSGLCLVLTVSVKKINPTADDMEDENSALLCLNSYLTNADSGGSTSSSSKKSSGPRERTASFHALKVPLKPLNGSVAQLNAILDKLLLAGKQLTVEDVQTHMSSNGDVSVKNTAISIECGMLVKQE